MILGSWKGIFLGAVPRYRMFLSEEELSEAGEEGLRRWGGMICLGNIVKRHLLVYYVL